MKEEFLKKENRDFWNNSDEDNIYIIIEVPGRKVREKARKII